MRISPIDYVLKLDVMATHMYQIAVCTVHCPLIKVCTLIAQRHPPKLHIVAVDLVEKITEGKVIRDC